MEKITSKNLVNFIMEYEGGNMTVADMFRMFGYLIKTGQAWTLQGRYGRHASSLIESGFISKKGRVQWKAVEKAGVDKTSMIYEE